MIDLRKKDRKIVRWHLCESPHKDVYNIESLSHQVSACLNNGWELFGDLKIKEITNDSAKYPIWRGQVMVKYADSLTINKMTGLTDDLLPLTIDNSAEIKAKHNMKIEKKYKGSKFVIVKYIDIDDDIWECTLDRFIELNELSRGSFMEIERREIEINETI